MHKTHNNFFLVSLLCVQTIISTCSGKCGGVCKQEMKQKQKKKPQQSNCVRNGSWINLE